MKKFGDLSNYHIYIKELNKLIVLGLLLELQVIQFYIHKINFKVLDMVHI